RLAVLQRGHLVAGIPAAELLALGGGPERVLLERDAFLVEHRADLEGVRAERVIEELHRTAPGPRAVSGAPPRSARSPAGGSRRSPGGAVRPARRRCDRARGRSPRDRGPARRRRPRAGGSGARPAP